MKKMLAALLALALCLGMAGCMAEDDMQEDFSGEMRMWIVGTDIGFEAIREFYYTYDASTAPPHYQRYRFSAQDGQRLFFHETREGGGWPQTEADITASGTLELTEGQWAAFCALLEGGAVRDREESLDDGDAGPWLYLYWDGDEDRFQEFSFADYGTRLEFEAFCEALRDEEAGEGA